MKCRICGKEFDKRNQMHCHMIRKHEAEYKAAQLNLDRLVEDITPRKEEQPDVKQRRKANLLPKPQGLRLLRNTDSQEAYAITQGFTYIDKEQNIYTIDDVKAEGWI